MKISPTELGWLDLKYSARSLVRSKGFSLSVVVTLALCIGAHAAIFSMVYHFLLKPLPYPNPDSIVEVYNSYPGMGIDKQPSNVAQYLDYQQHASSFEAVGLWSRYRGVFGARNATQPLEGALATAEVFRILRLQPVVGAFFNTANSQYGEEKVVVLAESFWEKQYQADPNVVGKSVTIDGETLTVIGVAPRLLEDFGVGVCYVRPVTWRPEDIGPYTRHNQWIQLYGRLRPGVTFTRASEELSGLERRFYQDVAPAELRQAIDRSAHKIGMGAAQAERLKPIRSKLYLLQGGAAFVLLIGCVNVANLLLVRSNQRRSEIAIRSTLGANRWWIARQLLCESFLLTLFGTLLGTAIAWGALSVLNYFVPRMIPGSAPVSLDGAILIAIALLSLLIAVLIGLVPVVCLFRTELTEALQGNGRAASAGRGLRRWSHVLVVGQVATTVILLTGAGLLIRSFANAVMVDPGFEPKHVLAGHIWLPPTVSKTEETSRSFLERLCLSIQQVPGVTSAAVSQSIPFQGGSSHFAVTFGDEVAISRSALPSAFFVSASPDYLKTIGLHLLEGRFFESADLARSAQVFVVDQSFAKKYFPGRSAVGAHLSNHGRPSKDSEWPIIIGVVRDIPHNGVEERSGIPFVYELPHGQPDTIALMVRTERPLAEVVPLLRETVFKLDPSAPLFGTAPMESLVEDSFTPRRGIMWLSISFGSLALFLSALGIYVVLAFEVSQRTREIGIRSAIGASRGQIMAMVLKQGMVKACFGLIIGLIGSFYLGEWITRLLFHVRPTDPFSLVSVSLVLLGVALVASWFPARAATRVDPVVALRAN